MTIRQATIEDCTELHRMYRVAYKNEIAYADYYFKYQFDPQKCWICEQDGQIVSYLSLKEHTININKRRVKYLMMTPVIQLPGYQEQAKQLIHTVLDIADHQCLLTMIHTDDCDFYREFGFEQVYQRKRTDFIRTDIKRYRTDCVLYEPKDEALLRVYREYIQSFEAYEERDVDYYRQLRIRLNAQNGSLIGYESSNQTLIGYMVLFEENNRCIVQEIVYVNGEALACMLAYAIAKKPQVTVYTSGKETFTKLVPNAKTEAFYGVMVRMNDAELFEKALQISASSAKEAFAQLKKPIHLNERF